MDRKSILALIIALIPAFAMAMPENDEATADTTANTATEKTYYIELISTVNTMNGSTTVKTDFGKFLPSSLGIKDADIKKLQTGLSFTNTADALNFWAAKGWSLVDTYIPSASNPSRTIVHMVLTITGEPKAVLQSIMGH